MTIILILLTIYIITLALTSSDGPYKSIARLRSNEKVDRFGLLNCYLCTSIWVSAIVCLLTLPINLEIIIYIFGLAGAATALHKLTTR